MVVSLRSETAYSPSWAPSRYVLAIFGLLAVMALSIMLAIVFPYPDDVPAPAPENVEPFPEININIVVEGDEADQAVTGDVGGSNHGVAPDATVNVGDESANDPEETAPPLADATDGNENGNGNAEEAKAPPAKAEEPEATATAADGDSDSGPKLQGADSDSGPKSQEGESSPATEEEPPTHHSSLFGHEGGDSTEDERREEECRSSLREADADADGVVDSSEYVAFVNDLQETHGLLGEAEHERYADLPYGLKVNFLHLSCVCPATVEGDCCAEKNGIYVGEGASEERLDKVCTQTLEAILSELDDGGQQGS